jgi:hypothetical protein
MTSGVDLGTTAELLQELLARQHQTTMAIGRADVGIQKAERAKALEDMNSALQKMKEAEGDDSPGFFECVGELFGDFFTDLFELEFAEAFENAGGNLEQAWNSKNFWNDLAAAASKVLDVVSTACACACAFMVAGYAGVAYVLKEPESPASKACAIGGQVMLAVATGGATTPLLVASTVAMSAGATIAYLQEQGVVNGEGWTYAAVGLSVAGAAVSIGGAVRSVASGARGLANAKNVAHMLRGAGQVVQGAAMLTGGLASARLAHFEASAEEAKAEQQKQRLKLERVSDLIRGLLEELKEVQASYSRTAQIVDEVLQTYNTAPMVALGAMRG